MCVVVARILFWGEIPPRDKKQSHRQLSRLEDEALLELGDKGEINNMFLDERYWLLPKTKVFGFPTLLIIWQAIWYIQICCPIKE